MNNNRSYTLDDLRKEIVGIDTTVPLLDGRQRRYVFLDNAASTPTFKSVLTTIEEFMPWYSGVHRGMGYKAVVATTAYDRAHEVAGEFVGADMKKNVAIFVKNTTEAANKLASKFQASKKLFSRDNVIIATMMEHHSNDLPWRKYCKVVHIPVKDDGGINLELLRNALQKYQRSVKLVAITGASNVTGICNPIHDIAEWVHSVGAKLFVDAAQLVPHRPVNILSNDDPRHIDFIAYSAHKIYAPFGTGVLIGPKDFFEESSPDLVGGGTVSYVGLDAVDWGHAPQKEEAGSPNVVGAVALARSLSILRSVGMDDIAEHEKKLLTYAYDKLKKIPKVRLYGPVDDYSKKVGVIPFNVDGLDHALVATILSVEGGVGVRNGNFCAQVYTRTLLHVTPEDERRARETQCTSPNLPGMVRASLGCYNNEEDIDVFIEMLEKICRGEFKGTYKVDPETGMYVSDHLTKHISQQFHFFDISESGAGVYKDEVA